MSFCITLQVASVGNILSCGINVSKMSYYFRTKNYVKMCVRTIFEVKHTEILMVPYLGIQERKYDKLPMPRICNSLDHNSSRHTYKSSS